MNDLQKYQLQDIVEQIIRIDKMIKIHSTNPSKIMLNQYKEKKEKLLGCLIDNLIAPPLRSLYSFRLILLAVKKFYPELIRNNNKKLSESKKFSELKSLETVLS